MSSTRGSAAGAGAGWSGGGGRGGRGRSHCTGHHPPPGAGNELDYFASYMLFCIVINSTATYLNRFYSTLFELSSVQICLHFSGKTLQVVPVIVNLD